MISIMLSTMLSTVFACDGGAAGERELWLQIDHLAVSKRNAGIGRGLRRLPKKAVHSGNQHTVQTTDHSDAQCNPAHGAHTVRSFAAASICSVTPGLFDYEGRSVPSSLVEIYLRCSSYHRITRSARSRLCFSRLNEWPAPGYKTNSVFTPYRLRPRYIS